MPPPAGLYDWKLAVVLEHRCQDGAKIGLGDGQRRPDPAGRAHLGAPCRSHQPRYGRGASRKPGDALAVGDVDRRRAASTKDAAGKDYPADTYGLRQIPEISGAMVAMDPHTGRVLAMTGGWSFQHSEFNRATQAMRQPGSAFKPIVYLTALENGFTPSTVIMDAPIVVDQGPGLPLWRPENYEKELPRPGHPAGRAGEVAQPDDRARRPGRRHGEGRRDGASVSAWSTICQPVLAMALGAGETTVLRLTTAYSIIVNGGKKVTPTLIDRVQDRSAAPCSAPTTGLATAAPAWTGRIRRRPRSPTTASRWSIPPAPTRWSP